MGSTSPSDHDSIPCVSTDSTSAATTLPSHLQPRRAAITRITNETQIQCSLSLDGGSLSPYDPSPSHFPDTTTSSSSSSSPTIPLPPPNRRHATQVTPTQSITIDTGLGFLDHMLHALAKHAGWSLAIRSHGDLYIDDHHTCEDVFLALGTAFSRALGPRSSLQRFGRGDAPLDEALSWAVIDISSRPYAVIDLGFRRESIGALSTEMLTHGLQSFAQASGTTLHVKCVYGDNDHHRAESAFKALAVAVRIACTRRGEGSVGWGDVVSTKGVLEH